MAGILVYIEADSGRVSPISFELLGAALQLAQGLGGPVEALVVSAHPEPLVQELSGADTVVTVSHPALDGYVPEAHQAVLDDAIRLRRPAVVLVGRTTAGIDLAAGAATASGRPLVACCVALRAVSDEIEADSQLYGGKLVATTRTSPPAVFSVVAGSFPEAAGHAAGSATCVAMPAPDALTRLRTRLVGTSTAGSDTVDITKAERIVSVGRGIGAPDDIELAQELATALSAELGASRPVVDSGWLPKERQVGKSGMTVKPRLYVAVGISGAPEHLEGMRTAGLIIAINTDPGAPIFQVADYGTTCDLGDLLPALSARLVATG
jgi:electron transfer flavoprotein alpha subunit